MLPEGHLAVADSFRPSNIVDMDEYDNSDEFVKEIKIADHFKPSNIVDIDEDDHDDEFVNEMKELNLQDDIAKWACDGRVPHTMINGLLKVLRKHNFNLPAKAETLLETPKNVDEKEKSGGKYTYFGIRKGITNLLSQSIDLNAIESGIHLSANVDGVPIFDGSDKSFWPILCTISNLLPAQPFVAALYMGDTKPSDLDFLTDFVQEIKTLFLGGILHNGKTIQVTLKSVVCDAPARAMVKGIIQFNGTYGCDYCEIRGVWKNGSMQFRDIDTLRTDASFRSKSNAKHHKVDSPFLDLPVDMVKCFPLDYMHLVNLGITKKLIGLWTG